jgi:hypothetical protein
LAGRARRWRRYAPRSGEVAHIDISRPAKWPSSCLIFIAMTKTIAGFFRTRIEGETAYNQLLASGFSRDQVSFVAGDTRGHQSPAIGPIEGTGADSEMPQDVAMGSAIGLVAGLVLLVIPGVGPFLAAGPLAAAMGGIAAGAGVGGVVGLLRDNGVSQEEAEFYEDGVRRGGSLITLRGASEEEEKKARDVMQKNGSIETEELIAQPRMTAGSARS